MTVHLDLGCGSVPRNPYFCDTVYGTDQCSSFGVDNLMVCNLGFERLPFDDSVFDSISAFDLLEHIPRQCYNANEKKTTFPFIELMNEVYRVLKNNGKFLALTPAYPSSQVFQDPTHVNFITDRTHSYFTIGGPDLSRYGYRGRFSALNVSRVFPEELYGSRVSFKLRAKMLRYRLFRLPISHLRWEFQAHK